MTEPEREARLIEIAPRRTDPDARPDPGPRSRSAGLAAGVGAVYQPVWNALTGRAPDYGIKDYDLCYFDPDPSWEAEDLQIKRARRLLPFAARRDG